MEGDYWFRKHTIQFADNVELYTWNLYNFINQCHPSKFNKIFLKEKINK